MENKKYLLGIIVLILVISIGVSFAYFATRTLLTGNGTNTQGTTVSLGDTTVNIEGSPDFSDTNIYPGHKTISKIKVTATGDKNVIYHLIWNGQNNLKTTLNYTVYKTTIEQNSSITCEKKEEGNITKIFYETCTESNFTNLGEVVSSGEITPTTEETTFKLVKNEEIQATNTGAIVYYYIILEYPNKEESQNIDMNGTFIGTTTIQTLEKKEIELATNYLTSKGEMVNENGFRYEGANPNNYVTFNNELWRIIGVFDVENSDTKKTESLVKLIRNESIGDMEWDSNEHNDWTNASLKTLLNEGAYYNRVNTYSKTGLTSEAKSMIQKVKWNIGGASTEDLKVDLTAEKFYAAERGTTGGKSAPSITEWNGYVGLMYPSDYGYAADSTSCPRTTTLYNYDNKSCTTTNWLYRKNFQWTIMPTSSFSNNAFSVDIRGGVRNGSATNSYGASPSIYLKSSVQIVDDGNDGSEAHPYNLSM